MSVSFVIPCYQEVESLALLGPSLAEMPADEIVFVDDGSCDGTWDALERLAAQDRRVVCVRHEQNRGVGAAMRTGFATSRGAVVVVYDADATYPLADAARLVETLDTDFVDVVTATPFAVGGGLEDVPFRRRLLSQGARLAWRLTVGEAAREVTCFTCAFRAYRREALDRLVFDADGFAAAAEILGRLLLTGHRVAEVPSTLGTRAAGQSKMRVGRALKGHLAAMAACLRSRMTTE